MEQRKTVIERAFEIAAQGECKTVTQVRAKLRAEGHFSIDSYLSGRHIRDQLKAVMRGEVI